jgi:hypothetical protein
MGLYCPNVFRHTVVPQETFRNNIPDDGRAHTGQTTVGPQFPPALFGAGGLDSPSKQHWLQVLTEVCIEV